MPEAPEVPAAAWCAAGLKQFRHKINCDFKNVSSFDSGWKKLGKSWDFMPLDFLCVWRLFSGTLCLSPGRWTPINFPVPYLKRRRSRALLGPLQGSSSLCTRLLVILEMFQVSIPNEKTWKILRFHVSGFLGCLKIIFWNFVPVARSVDAY